MSMTSHSTKEGGIHIIGAGLAGLAAAVRLAQAGYRPTLYESADHAGGRCRSLFETTLERLIDNGNHLLLSGNKAAMDYLHAIGAHRELSVAPRAVYPFVDIRDGRRWSVRPNRGRIPWWIFSQSSRVPESRPWDYFAALSLALAQPGKTVADCFDT
ncbi:MAG: FAD-dependent oxidoreductase, partial [Alphaproteobacteria bacterium]|nr:FAD-dependent oxidoreductase [Alphaproteobacteria bacterium]